MCTLSLVALREGYRLGMNRDEQRTRPLALPPARFDSADGIVAIGPREPGGGMWIAVNAAGVTLALLNWYSVSQPATPVARSRGELIRELRHVASLDSVTAALSARAVDGVHPFRLVGIEPGRAIEWRWNGETLDCVGHPWRTGQWISSGFEEHEAQRVRGATFEVALRDADAGSAEWLRRLHASHAPGQGPFSTCMHRADAASVSYTGIECDAASVRLTYHPGSPCQPVATSEWMEPRR